MANGVEGEERVAGGGWDILRGAGSGNVAQDSQDPGWAFLLVLYSAVQGLGEPHEEGSPAQPTAILHAGTQGMAFGGHVLDLRLIHSTCE